MEIDRRLSEDRKRARITFPVAEFDVDVAGLKELIAALGATRTAMQPEEPALYVPPEPVLATLDPPWTAEPERLDECVLLHLRDPRFGWLSYSLPKSSAEQLGTHLLALARANIPEGKPN